MARRKFRCWICRRVVQAAAYLDEQGLLEDAQRDGEEACHECSDTVREEAIEDAIEHRHPGRAFVCWPEDDAARDDGAP
jgi:hypothetical protein